MIHNAEDAARVGLLLPVPAARGAELTGGALDPAFGTGREHTDAANAAVLAFAQIETADGFANVEAICATLGLDGVYVGPADLSLTLGFEGFADLASREMLDALDQVVAAASAQEVIPGIDAPSIERAVEMARRGFRFGGFAAGDTELLRAGAAESIERTRADVRAG